MINLNIAVWLCWLSS